MTLPLLGRCVGVLHSTIRAAAGVDITYHSWHSDQHYNICAVKVSSTGEKETEEGLIQKYHLATWKIKITSLPVIPQLRDTITYVNPNGVTQEYEVLSEGAQREVIEGDNFSTYWEVHSKMVLGDPTDVVAHGASDGTAHGNQDGTAYGSSPY